MKRTIKLIALLLTLSFSGMSFAATVNINTATKAELMTLKGIGEVRAEAIMKYRRGNKFGSPADIKDVPGIGEAIYKDNARLMKASGRTTVKPSQSTAKTKSTSQSAKSKASKVKDKTKKSTKAETTKAASSRKSKAKKAKTKVESKKKTTKKKAKSKKK